MFRDRDLIKKTENPRIVKGGSWADAPCYMICQAREVRPKDYTSCRIGFRVAMSLSPEIIKFLQKN